MSVIKLGYSSRPILVPTRVYCDTSFVHQLYIANNSNRLNQLSPAARREALAARDLFIWARQQGVVFVTSVFALEEELHLLLQPIRDEAASRQMRGWKQLRADDGQVFATLLARSRTAIARFNSFFAASGIRLVGGGRLYTPDESNLPRRVYAFARMLMNAFELDPMDAFHIAIARYYRIDWAATADSDWQHTDRINLFCPR